MTAARVLKVLYLALGTVLLVWIIGQVDGDEVWHRLAEIGAAGFALVLILYLAAFTIDSVSWLLTIETAPLSRRWIGRTFAVRMAGEAYNTVLPAAGMGGEPLKAEILNRRYGIGLKEGAASLVMAKTVNLMALVVFLIVGFVLMMRAQALPAWTANVAALGLVALATGTGLFFALQRLQLSSRLAARMARHAWGGRIGDVLHHLEDVDARFARFYARHRGRLAAALALAIANWLLGVAEVYVAMAFLGHPVDWTTAWIIEAAAQMIRAAAFFVPAAIGVQEGTFVFLCAALTGNPALGLAVGAVRRIREVVWIVLGMGFAWILARRGPSAPA